MTLVELLVAMTIVLAVIVVLVAINTFYVRTARNNIKQIKAFYLAEEGIEALRYLRDLGWSENVATLTLGTPYYLEFDGAMWLPTTTAIYVDGEYERTFTLTAVNRDANDQIAVSGTNDPETFKTTINVSWSSGTSTTTKTLSSYVNNLFQN